MHNHTPMRYYAWASITAPLRPPVDADEWVRVTQGHDGGVWCHVKRQRSGLRLQAALPFATQLDVPALNSLGSSAANGDSTASDPGIRAIAAAFRSTRASGLCHMSSPSSATFWINFHTRAPDFVRISHISAISPGDGDVGAGEADEEAIRLGPFYAAISRGRKHFSGLRSRVAGYVDPCVPIHPPVPASQPALSPTHLRPGPLSHPPAAQGRV